ncbi:MAG TPA: 3-dehydroquinate synthase [Thermodesulfobacteriota bacterium]
MSRIRVDLADRSYDIQIKRGLLRDIGPGMKALGLKGPAAVVTNPRVDGLYGNAVTDSLSSSGFTPLVINVPDGEEYKSLAEASKVFDVLIENRFERKSPIVALGGGVIGDLAGFVAATYLRGVPLIQVPTTLLSQVDSSVGGKTAVNHPKGKNLIGAFYQPMAVFIDPDVLKTLEEREIKAGLAEVIKYGVIRDPGFFTYLEENAKGLLSNDKIIKAIERSCEIKAEIVGKDEKEEGLRAILNFGHTFGHAIEALSGYGSYRHGEAVAIGMAMAAALSARLGMCQECGAKITALLSSLGMPSSPPAISPKDFIDAMRLDKKVSGKAIRFVLPVKMGEVTVKEVGEEVLMDFLASYARF